MNCKCKQCDKDFEAKTMFANYCSGRCRQAKYRSTRKGKQHIKTYNHEYYKLNRETGIAV